MRLLMRACLVSLVLSGCLREPSAAPQPAGAEAQSILVGWASVDITPDKPVALVGQKRKRISTGVRDPLTATALALETRADNAKGEQAILVSCDVIFIKKIVQDKLRRIVKSGIPDFDVDKLFLNATHTHTAPGFIDGAFYGLYDVSNDAGVMKASEYAEFFIERVAGAVVKAWKTRTPGQMGWALGHAVIGRNRRAQYFDGTAAMYGDTKREGFSRVEGYEDHGVGMLFFWNGESRLSGIVINVACPSQETENLSVISADFWHDAREEIRKRIGREVFILPQCGAAGDQSPHLMFSKRAEDVMLQRRGLSRRQEIARRIADAVDDALPLAEKERTGAIVFKHAVAKISLPPHEPANPPFGSTDTIDPIEIHVLRLGDVALATNPFELYLDYGIRIKARSPAALTLLSQISCQTCGYLPTEKAVRGGGYSAEKFIVGPKGGQVLVNETLKRINSLWE